MILREIKSSLNGLDRLLESEIISKMISGKDPSDIANSISKIKNLDGVILKAIKDGKDFKSVISKLDDEKSTMLIDVMGQLRGSLAPSTFTRLKKEIIEANPKLKDKMSAM